MMKWDDSMIRREYRKALFPVVASALGGTINTLIDSAFVSQSLGSNAMAAVTLCMPIYLVLCVVGVWFAAGASIAAAWEIGKNKTDEANKLYNSSLAWYLVMGVVLTVLGTVFIGPISRMIAQGSNLVNYVHDYGLVSVLGTFPTILIYQPIRFLQLDGRVKNISRMTILMIVTDVILDYLFLFVWKTGIGGAAVASVISTAIACVYGFVILQRGHLFKFSLRSLKLYRTKKILHAGSPSALGNLVDMIKMVILNGIILYNFGADGTAVWAVLNSLSEISLSVIDGIPQTAAPMIAVFFPSRENNAIRALMKRQVEWGLSVLLVFDLLLVFGNDLVARLFSIGQDLLVPLICLGIYILFDMLAGIWFRYLNVIGRVALSNTVNVARKLLIPVVLTHIHLFRGDHFWYFLPASGLVTLLFGVILLKIESKKALKKENKLLSPLLLLNDELERTKKVLDFSISPDEAEVCDAAEKISEFCEVHGMDKKMLMRLSLSIEEILVILIKHVPSAGSVDLRAFVIRTETGIQMRYIGDYYDPFEEAEKDESDELMGVLMMKKLASTTDHYYALGINTIHLFFER